MHVPSIYTKTAQGIFYPKFLQVLVLTQEKEVVPDKAQPLQQLLKSRIL
jgi:hypothetical protein